MGITREVLLLRMWMPVGQKIISRLSTRTSSKCTVVAKQETEYAQFELAEAERLKRELLAVADGDSYLKEQVIELRYQNHVLKEENRTLKDKLEQAYEFMKQFVIDGMNLLEKFMDWIGEKVRDVRGRY